MITRLGEQPTANSCVVDGSCEKKEINTLPRRLHVAFCNMPVILYYAVGYYHY